MWKTRYPLTLLCSWDPHWGRLGHCPTVQHHALPLPGLCLFLCLISPHRKAKGLFSYFPINGSWRLMWLFYLAVHVSNYTQRAGALQTLWVGFLLVRYPTHFLLVHINAKVPFHRFFPSSCVSKSSAGSVKLPFGHKKPNSCWFQWREFQWLQWSHACVRGYKIKLAQ